MKLEFFMPMQPPTVTHQDKELRAFIQGGRPRAIIHDSPRLKDAKAKIRGALSAHRPEEPLAGPVRLVVKWLFAPPRGRKVEYGQYKDTKPDTDNLEKALKDEMTNLGFWHDDAQVASEIVEKFWDRIPGIWVHVEEIKEEQ